MTPEMVDRARSNAKKQGVDNVEFHLSTIDKLPLASGSVDCVISNCVINLAPDKTAVFREIYRVLKPGGRVAVSDIALKKELPPEVGADLLAYVGCVTGAIPISEYIASLKAAGFAAVQVVDTKKNLNAYAQVEGQGGCCTPAMKRSTPAASECCTPAPAGSSECCTQKADAEPMAEECCTPAQRGSASCCTMNAPADTTIHGGLAELLKKYDVNDFAASVQVYAVKE